MYIYLENVNIFYYINILIYLKDQFCGQINTKDVYLLNYKHLKFVNNLM